MNNNQLIARFKYEKKLFCILLSKERKILFSYLDEKGNVCFDLNEDELKLSEEIFNSLLINIQKSYYIRDEKVNNKTYKIYRDETNKNYFWKSNTNETGANDNVFLNMKYNNMPNIVYYEDNFMKEYEKYIKWQKKDSTMWFTGSKEFRKEHFSKKRKKISPILVNAGISLVFITQMIFIGYIGYDGAKRIQELENERNASISIIETEKQYTKPSIIETEPIEEKDNYNWETIKQAIESNPNLANSEKEFLKEIKFVFDENHQYMDLDLIITRLETLSIEYIEDFCKDDYTIRGLYHYDENKIECFKSKSIKDVNLNIFLHEFFHVLQSGSSHFIHELSNEMFRSETIRRLHTEAKLDNFYIPMDTTGAYKYGNGYDNYMYIYNYLAEILPQEELKKYQFSCNERHLVNALCSESTDLNRDVTRAWELIDLIDTLHPIYGSVDRIFAHEYKDEVCEKIDYFYQLKGIDKSKNINCALFELEFSTTFSEHLGQLLLEAIDKKTLL